MPGYVYLIGSSVFHWYKIGKTANVKIRTKELGILLPFRIEVVAVWKTEKYHVVEKELHKRLSANRINGEWFLLSKTEVEAIVCEMSWAITEATIGFENMKEDCLPKGMIVTVRQKDGFAGTLDLSPQERDRRRQEAMAKRDAKKNAKVFLTEEERMRRECTGRANSFERKENKRLHYYIGL